MPLMPALAVIPTGLGVSLQPFELGNRQNAEPTPLTSH